MTLFVLMSFTTSFNVNAADNPHVQIVYSINTHSNTQAYLEAIKPVIARVKKLSPKTSIRVYEAQFAGAGAGNVYVVVEQPSMSYMDENREKMQNDAELSKLFPKLTETGTREATSLYVDRAPMQATGVNNRVQVVYAVDTHGKTQAYLEATKKLDARYLSLSPKSTVRVFESLYAGNGAGLVLVIVGYPDLTYLEGNTDRIGDDPELVKLFTARQEIGATVESVSLLNDVTP